jgi:archaetidylinositol phosphate synthase
MLSIKKDKFRPLLNPLVKHMSKVDPNSLTLIGSIPPLLFFFLVIYHLYILALFALIACLLDMLDGTVARTYNKVTKFGGFLDSTIDRISDFLIIGAFAFGNIVHWQITFSLLSASFLTSYTRCRAELAKPGLSMALGIVERPERLILIFIALLSYILYPTIHIINLNLAESVFILTLALSVLTIFQRLVFSYNNI